MPETELHKAARDGDKDGVEDLIRQGLNVNEQGAQGRTALHRALGGGHADCARLLIDKGADPNKADTLKRTPLHWASMGPPPDNVACCELIFEKGDGPAMMLKETKSGSTPLHSAAGTNRAEVVRFLITKEADLTAKDEDGCTPYELAKVRSPLSSCELLSPHELSRVLTCRRASVSQKDGLSEIAAILKEAGGGGGRASSSSTVKVSSGGGGGGGGGGCCVLQ